MQPYTLLGMMRPNCIAPGGRLAKQGQKAPATMRLETVLGAPISLEREREMLMYYRYYGPHESRRILLLFESSITQYLRLGTEVCVIL